MALVLGVSVISMELVNFNETAAELVSKAQNCEVQINFNALLIDGFWILLMYVLLLVLVLLVTVIVIIVVYCCCCKKDKKCCKTTNEDVKSDPDSAIEMVEIEEEETNNETENDEKDNEDSSQNAGPTKTVYPNRQKKDTCRFMNVRKYTNLDKFRSRQGDFRTDTELLHKEEEERQRLERQQQAINSPGEEQEPKGAENTEVIIYAPVCLSCSCFRKIKVMSLYRTRLHLQILC